MHYTINKVKLTSGEELQLLWVRPPEPVWGSAIESFLAHKPQKYKDHLRKVFSGEYTSQTMFYIGLIEDRLVAIAMTLMRERVAHLAHCFVLEEHRNKSIGTHLLAHLLEDFKWPVCRVLILGTEFGGAAHRLYTKLGFKAWPNKPGIMHRIPTGYQGTLLLDEYLDEERFFQ